MRVRVDLHACVYRWLGIDGRASVCMHIYTYIYIYNYIYIPIIYLLCTYMHASCMDPLCTQVSMSVCTQTDRYRRGARVSLAIRSAEYIMCMDIRLYLDTCTSERRRGARVGVRLWRVRARMRPVG